MNERHLDRCDERPLGWQRIFLSANAAQTVAVGRWVGRAARAGDVIALVGELGAGKTHWVRGLAEGLGLDPRQVSSPTFVLSQEYEPEAGDVPVLVHIDAYRLRGAADLETLGWGRQGEELARDAVVVVEWADRIADHLPAEALQVTLRHMPEGRRIVLASESDGGWARRLDRLSDDWPCEESRTP